MADLRPRRLTRLLARLSFSFSGSPSIGAEDEMGEPGSMPTELRLGDVEEEEMLEDDAGELYRYVAARTMDEPTTKAAVIGYEKRATEARKEMMMESEVAKPFLEGQHVTGTGATGASGVRQTRPT